MNADALRRRLTEWVRLTRLDRPVGILLLLWPVLWALWLASDGLPPFSLLVVFVLGTVLTRSAGCVINDFLDRDIDPHVARTRDRPLAARRVSPQEALTLCALLLGLAFALVLTLDLPTVAMSVVAAGLMLTYPFFKRFFPAPQLYLGIAFGWGVPMAFMATQGEVPLIGWGLFAVTALWALIYDTFYAMVDREDDRRIGVRSTALWFGRFDLPMIALLQGTMILGLAMVGRAAGFGFPYFVALGIATTLFARHLWLARRRTGPECFRAFLGNQSVGLVVFVGIVLATAQR